MLTPGNYRKKRTYRYRSIYRQIPEQRGTAGVRHPHAGGSYGGLRP